MEHHATLSAGIAVRFAATGAHREAASAAATAAAARGHRAPWAHARARCWSGQPRQRRTQIHRLHVRQPTGPRDDLRDLRPRLERHRALTHRNNSAHPAAFDESEESAKTRKRDSRASSDAAVERHPPRELCVVPGRGGRRPQRRWASTRRPDTPAISMATGQSIRSRNGTTVARKSLLAGSSNRGSQWA